ncbi:MAG: GNAT family N-acetyltransferase [Planctomycetes bacterium]|nr:GNAT family N-acetyltransferase [Planctomycetota bacterium]MBI3834207.1 GNAT family N-acetyltransferase [Planctomycetota bacterium]
MNSTTILDSPRTDIQIVQLSRDHADFRLALETALEAGWCRGPTSIQHFLEDNDQRKIQSDLIFAAYAGGAMITSLVVLESPGRAALIVCPSGLLWHGDRDLWQGAATRMLRVASRSAFERGSILLQILTPPEECPMCISTLSAGFRRLTRLAYLVRDVNASNPGMGKEPNLNWSVFDPQVRIFFERTLESSYAQSMDCPELTGLRSIQDVLAGHTATGHHDPRLWLVASEGNHPLGIILLSPISGSQIVEVVYMGVAQPVRGIGVGNALLRQGLLVARSFGAMKMALAVDVRNTPARRLYERWRFRTDGFRDAWIATHENAKS